MLGTFSSACHVDGRDTFVNKKVMRKNAIGRRQNELKTENGTAKHYRTRRNRSFN